MAAGREQAVEKVRAMLTAGDLDADQLLKLVKEWAPADERLGPRLTVILEAGGGVRLVSDAVDAETEEL